MEKRVAVAETATRLVSHLNGCVLYYSFDKDEGEKVTDKSLKRNNGRVFGGKWVREGKVGAGYSFDGKTSYISVPNNPSMNFGYADFTYSYWVMRRTVTHQSLVGHGYNPES